MAVFVLRRKRVKKRTKIKDFTGVTRILLLSVGLLAIFIFFSVSLSQKESNIVEASADNWYFVDWKNRAKITVKNSQVVEGLTDFPVYVSLGVLDNTFFSNVKTDGSDIIVTKGDGSTKLSRELVEIDTSAKTGELWFKAPSLSSTQDTEFYIYYNNPSANETNTADVWSAGYNLVWHFTEEGLVQNGGGEVLDSSRNSNHGSTGTGISALSSESGLIGTSYKTDFNSGDYVRIASNSTLEPTNFTVSAWAKGGSGHAFDPNWNATGWVFNKRISTVLNGNGILLYPVANTKEFRFYIGDGTTYPSASSITPNDIKSWHYYSASYNGTNFTGYFNGSITSSVAVSTPSYGGGYIYIGKDYCQEFKPGCEERFGIGSIDEVRMSSVVRSEGWLKTEYNNQSNVNNFLSISASESKYEPTDWFTAGWQNRVKITIPSSQVDEDLTDFPVYVDLSDLGDGFFERVQGDGGDIIVTTADSLTKLHRELVVIDTQNKTGELWFRANKLSSTTNNEFYIYYNNADAQESNSTEVWSNGYVAVWHMNQDPSITTDGPCAGKGMAICDSTGNNLASTMYGAMTSADKVDGLMGNAIDFDGTNDAIGIQSSELDTRFDGDKGTITGWAKVANVGVWTDGVTREPIRLLEDFTYDYLLFRKNGSINNEFFQLRRSNQINQQINTTTSTTDWFKFDLTYNTVEDRLEAFFNGVSQNQLSNLEIWGISSFLSSNTNIGAANQTGASPWSGQIDEIRIANTARSDGWVSTEYNNQSDTSTFYSVSSEEGPNNYDWIKSEWGYRIKITIPANRVSFDSGRFPVYVDLSTLDPHLFNHIKSNGGDIVVTDSDGITKVNSELVDINVAEKTGELWFKATSIYVSSDADFYIYYGNSIWDEEKSTEVWSAGYELVWHLNEDPTPNGGYEIYDSSGNNNWGTTGTGMNIATVVDGITNKSYDFNAEFGDYISMLSNSTIEPANFTVSAWAKSDNANWNSSGWLVNKRDLNDPFGTYILHPNGTATSMNYVIRDGGTVSVVGYTPTVPITQWNNYAMTFNGTGFNAYFNGAGVGTTTPTSPIYSGGTLFIGQDSCLYTNPACAGRFADAKIDEIRISSTPRYSSWLTAEYNNLNSPSTFYNSSAYEENNPKDWYDSNWQFRKKLTISGAQVDDNVDQFPVFVDLSDLGANFFSNIRSDGKDIIAVSGDSLMKLDRELVNFNIGNETGELWVKLDLTQNESKDFYIYFGNPNGIEEDNSDVWDNNFSLVWHLSDNLTMVDGEEVFDSSGNGNNGSVGTGTNTIEAGAVGEAYRTYFEDGSYLKVNSNHTLEGDNLTFSAWARGGFGAFSPNWNKPGWLLNKRYFAEPDWNGYLLAPQGPGNTKDIRYYMGDTTSWKFTTYTPSDVQTWNMYSGTYDGTNLVSYFNGGNVGSVGVSTPRYADGDLVSGKDGCQEFVSACSGWFGVGWVDEVRITTDVRSAGWLSTEYNNQSSPTTFYSVGLIENIAQRVFTVTPDSDVISTENDIFVCTYAVEDITNESLIRYSFENEYQISGAGLFSDSDVTVTCDDDGVEGGTATTLSNTTINRQSSTDIEFDLNTDSCTSTKWVCMDFSGTNRFVNPANQGNYVWRTDVDVNGDRSNDYSEELLSYIGEENKASIIGYIPTILGMKLYEPGTDNAQNSCDFSNITLNTVSTCTYDIGISQNTDLGAIVTIQADGNLRTTGGDDIDNCTGTNCDGFGSSGVDAGQEEYGFYISDLGDGLFTAEGSYGTAHQMVPQVETVFASTNSSSSGTVAGNFAQRLELTHAASVNNTTPEGLYFHTISFKLYSK